MPPSPGRRQHFLTLACLARLAPRYLVAYIELQEATPCSANVGGLNLPLHRFSSLRRRGVWPRLYLNVYLTGRAENIYFEERRILVCYCVDKAHIHTVCDRR